jgi:hypothetical protein
MPPLLAPMNMASNQTLSATLHQRDRSGSNSVYCPSIRFTVLSFLLSFNFGS